jgi:REP element-mobilizing transposase RayT
MARKPRIHFPGALFHVITRGNARQKIFLGFSILLKGAEISHICI